MFNGAICSKSWFLSQLFSQIAPLKFHSHHPQSSSLTSCLTITESHLELKAMGQIKKRAFSVCFWMLLENSTKYEYIFMKAKKATVVFFLDFSMHKCYMLCFLPCKSLFNMTCVYMQSHDHVVYHLRYIYSYTHITRQGGVFSLWTKCYSWGTWKMKVFPLLILTSPYPSLHLCMGKMSSLFLFRSH